jgi:mannose-6-phosphate isomerase-like protein (cupin superfamily)
MAYTVKQLAAMSGVSVRTLHFYDETGLLEPAYCGANGYRFYEKQQLLMFRGFKAAEGKDRFEERIEISGDLAACKVSAQDTQGAMCVFELTGGHYCGPRHMHHDQDEWTYIIDGECDFEIGGQLLRAHTGDTVFLPRNVAHG